MPLSEHEQRLLEQMERALYEEDPKFASQLRGADVRAARRRIGLALLGFLIGLGLMLGGVITSIPLISILGFVQMLVSVTYVMSWWGKAPSAPVDASGAAGPGGGSGRPTAGSSKGGKAKRGSFMDGVEERWRRRREEGGR